MELFDTQGIDLKKIAEDARANKYPKQAEAIEKRIADFQALYDYFARRHAFAPDKPLYNVDVPDIENASADWTIADPRGY